MLGKFVLPFVAMIVALVFLFISLLRTTQIRYDFELPADNFSQDQPEKEIEIVYPLPYPGKIYPDNPLWALKVVRDKVWVLVSVNSEKKGETLLFLADKRLATAQSLIENGKMELALSTSLKAEAYLSQSFEIAKALCGGPKIPKYFQHLAWSTLKHRQILEEFLEISPNDAKPMITLALDTPKMLFDSVEKCLTESGYTAPKNPF